MQELEIKLLGIDVEKTQLRRTDVGNVMTFTRKLEDTGISKNDRHKCIIHVNRLILPPKEKSFSNSEHSDWLKYIRFLGFMLEIQY